MDSPCDGQFLAGKRGGVIVSTMIGLNAPLSHTTPGLAPQPPYFGS
jgi:hypothetical protein